MGIFSSLFSSQQSIDPNLRPVVLLMLDGWGIAPPSHGNAISQAKLPNWNHFITNFPNCQLIASGESVGLPANEVGNSEVGHLTIGVGRVILESLLRINQAIESGEFFTNQAFQSAASQVLKNNSTLHIMGLTSTGNVHASLPHLYGLLDFAKRARLPKVAVHCFTDGRDAPPQDGINTIRQLEADLVENYPFARIASVSGRYYAMDRDNRWERTQKTYDALTLGKGPHAESASQAIEASYQAQKTDEFVEPTMIVPSGQEPFVIEDGDAVIFFNFRVDRPRQLTKVFVQPDFEKTVLLEKKSSRDIKHPLSIFQPDTQVSTFNRDKKFTDLFFVTMTEYQKNVPVSAIAYGNEVVRIPMSEVISQHNLSQLHLAESEKERMVTYYFDGMRLEPFPGEEIVIIPSPKVGTYDKKPEMALPGVVKEFKKQLLDKHFQFIVMNFANPDMVAHTGNLQATIKACEHVDWALGELYSLVTKMNGSIFITADHGNAEELLTFDPSTFFYTTREGDTNTEHSNLPVPFVMINNDYIGKPQAMVNGSLSDVAPTILNFMKLPVPPEMTGKNLLTM